MNKHNYVVIMAGGIGSRFWPMSRTSYPKQFHDILGTGKTLLQQTVGRYQEVCPEENIYIVTNQEYYSLVKQQLPFMTDDQILLEPMMRNTAPCVAYAAAKIYKHDQKANLVVSPSDHVILKEDAFTATIKTALNETASKNILLTLGIKPHRPDTGYGYIQYLENSGAVINKVKTFTEKPHLELALEFLRSGDYVWNSGLFIWNAATILKAFETHLPEMYEIFQDGNDAYFTEDEAEFLATAYAQCKSISIDYGIMEKSNEVFVLLSDFGWSDLGTWKSLYDISSKDDQGNVINADTLVYDATNCLIKSTSEGKLIVVHGLHNFIVAESGDVLMICPIEEEQKVKDFVNDAKAQKDKRFT